VRQPTITQIRSAASVLSRAAMAEAARIREEQGHAGHVAAQELEHQAICIGGLAARIESMRARR
jgi:hypothetical protein